MIFLTYHQLTTLSQHFTIIIKVLRQFLKPVADLSRTLIVAIFSKILTERGALADWRNFRPSCFITGWKEPPESSEELERSAKRRDVSNGSLLTLVWNYFSVFVIYFSNKLYTFFVLNRPLKISRLRNSVKQTKNCWFCDESETNLLIIIMELHGASSGIMHEHRGKQKVL